MVTTEKLTIKSTDNAPELINITKTVKEIVKKSRVKNGQVLVFAQHTTAAIVIQENETGLYKDLVNFLEKLAPKDNHYHHNDVALSIPDEPLNAHSHCRHLLLGCSEVVPIEKGELLLGTYQHIFLIELDHSRQRTIVVQVMGEK